MIPECGPYAVRKDSGVPWLGDVPQHWRVLPGRACYREKKIPNTGLKEVQVLSLSFGRIVIKPADKLRGLLPASFETYQVVDPGDIVVRPTDLQNDWNSLRFGLSRDRGIITSAYLCFRIRGEMTCEYGYSLLLAYDLKKIFYGLGSGLRQNLDWSDFTHLPCLVPPADEQVAIVRFLDHTDRRIRRAIRAKQKLITLLNEQKQALIHRAVTRGLDPEVRLKPSGVELLGDVPEHWVMRPAKYFYREVDRRSTTGDQELLSVSHLTGVTPRSQKNITMFKASSYAGHKLCKPGDLVINTMWAWMGALGVAPVEGIVSPAYAVYRPTHVEELLVSYAGLLLMTRPYVTEYLYRSTGIRSSRLRLYPDQFLRIGIACPPAHEQRAILDHVTGEVSGTDRAIATADREITLLREYRTRLIADVVTGKIDVRAAAAQLPDEIEEPEPLDDADLESGDFLEGDVADRELEEAEA